MGVSEPFIRRPIATSLLGIALLIGGALGYFALPVLVGDDIVAALDLKTDRQNRKLLMQKWSWIGNGKKQAGRKELKRRIEEELDRFERFQLAD